MKLAIGADHAGYPLKEEVRGYLEKLGHEVIDLGAFNAEPSDYPDFAQFLVEQHIDSISVTPDSLVKTVRAIHQVEQQLLAKLAESEVKQPV